LCHKGYALFGRRQPVLPGRTQDAFRSRVPELDTETRHRARLGRHSCMPGRRRSKSVSHRSCCDRKTRTMLACSPALHLPQARPAGRATGALGVQCYAAVPRGVRAVAMSSTSRLPSAIARTRWKASSSASSTGSPLVSRKTVVASHPSRLLPSTNA